MLHVTYYIIIYNIYTLYNNMHAWSTELTYEVYIYILVILADLMLVSSLKVGDYILDSYDYDMGVGTMTATFERESFLLIDTVMVQNIFGRKLNKDTTKWKN